MLHQESLWIMSGLGICSLVFPAIPLFFVNKRVFTCEKEWITPVALLSWATWANQSRVLFCHERPEQITHGHSFIKNDGSESLKTLFNKERMSEEWHKLFVLGHIKGGKQSKPYKNSHFLSPLLFICKQSAQVMSESLTWATKGICSRRSLVKSNVSESLMVTLL